MICLKFSYNVRAIFERFLWLPILDWSYTGDFPGIYEVQFLRKLWGPQGDGGKCKQTENSPNSHHSCSGYLSLGTGYDWGATDKLKLIS